MTVLCAAVCVGGLCAEDATFADRRDVLTMLDDDGFLYVAGGTDYDTGATFNDGPSSDSLCHPP